jgi:hypothetical protein
MGRASSPLRDHVIFVEGAPRSGTTWLVNLLAMHPEIAGVEAESHLFDFGVGQLFDNYEGRHPLFHGLWAYLERDELLDLVRDACDRILMAMRVHVSGASVPPFVVEKTPTRADLRGLDLARKRECFPDAWYIHIIRDKDAVTRSLMRATFMPDRSRKAAARVWEQSVQQIRAAFGDLPRYRELSYETLQRNPAGECRALFEWLGLEVTDEVLDTMDVLSRDYYSDLRPALQPVFGSLVAALKRELLTHGQHLLRRVSSRSTSPRIAVENQAATSFVAALRSGDLEGLRAVSNPSLELVFRSAEDDRSLRGDDALRALAKLSAEAFSRSYVRESWTSAGATPSEWWTSAPGMPFWSAFFSGLAGDATRVDIAIGLVVDNKAVRRVMIVSAGPLSGRPLLHEADVLPELGRAG